MFTRRTFFRGTALGIGGAYLSPFLKDLSGNENSPTPPQRVVFFVQGNGIYPQEIQPKTIERKKKPSKIEQQSLDGHDLPLSLSPLNPWKKKMSIIHGLSGRVARGSHNSGFAALGCWPMGKKAFGETIDAAISKKLGGIYPHIGLGVSNKSSAVTYNLTSTEKGKALPTILNPLLAHQQYFRAGASGTLRKEFDVDSHLLDFMADDVKRMRSKLNSTEKEKLDRYLEAFEKMSQRQSQLARMSKQIQKATPKIDPKIGSIKETKNSETGVFERLEAQFEIAAGTLIAGLTNVVTISAGAGPDRIGLSCMANEIDAKGGYVGAHAIGHGSNPHGKSSSEWHALIRKKCLEKLAQLIQQLESIPEGSGSMLDHTLIVYMSDSAEGHHPRCEEWPFVLIGNLNGKLKLGNTYLRYPWYGNSGHRTIANLYLSILHALGDRRKNFGIHDLQLQDLDQTGPLAELMV